MTVFFIKSNMQRHRLLGIKKINLGLRREGNVTRAKKIKKERKKKREGEQKG